MKKSIWLVGSSPTLVTILITNSSGDRVTSINMTLRMIRKTQQTLSINSLFNSAPLCNGSTTDFGSVSGGSNPPGATQLGNNARRLCSKSR